jgi:hypothetical protein
MRRLMPWISVGGLILLVGGAATASALTEPSHGSVATSGVPQQPVALPILSTGTEPVPASTTPEPPPVQASVPTSSPPSSEATSTTPSVQAAACQGSQFLGVLATDKATYQTGETVQITLSVKNSGPTCAGLESASTGPCGLGNVTATNAAGQDVWDADASASGLPIPCPAILIQPVAAGWSTTVQLSWTQDQCTAGYSPGPPPTNPRCPQSQVAPGPYSLVGQWNGTSGNDESQTQRVTITIT